MILFPFSKGEIVENEKNVEEVVGCGMRLVDARDDARNNCAWG
jgi:hypothetical protein